MPLRSWRMRKRAIFALVCDFLFLILGVRKAISFVRWARVERGFGSVQVGQTRLAGVSKPRKPNYYSGRCGVIANPPPACSTEYVYGHPFAPLAPEYYIVFFSSDERAFQADRWSSP